MGETTRAEAKVSETKKENVASQKQNTDLSQLICSPAEQILLLQRTIGNEAVGRLIRSGALQAKFRIGRPGDKYEQEADRVADQVIRMPEVSTETKAADNIRGESIKHSSDNGTKSGKEGVVEALKKKEAFDSTPEVTPELESSISAVSGGGQPLSESVRAFYEPRFGVDFSQVRVHTGSHAVEIAKSINAKAFTVGQNIAFGGGQFAPESKEGQRLIAHELTHTIQQGHTVQRSLQISKTLTTPLVQRGLIPEFLIKKATDFISRNAQAIPGFTMFTVVIGKNPLTGASVDRSPGNILKGAIQMIPGGNFITEALNNHGIFDKVSTWTLQKFNTLKEIGSNIWEDIKNFVKGLSISDITDLGGVWNRAQNIVIAPVNQITSFAIGLKNDIVTFVKDAILKPIAAYAKSNTNGYPLLCAVMGKDPITDEAVPQEANTLLGAFMKFIGEEEIWNNMQNAKAVPRAFAWFKNAASELKGFVSEIPGLFIAAFKALDISDIVLIPKAFIKLAKVFGSFAGRFISWGANAVWNLLEIIFDSVKPGLMGYIKRTGAALKSILKNPIPFAGNLVKAAVTGFQNFANNIGAHLKAGLIDWLTGSLSGVYIPKALTLAELGKFALSVLGITWAQIRGKIVKALGPKGETIMTALETGFDIIVALVKGGPGAAWELIKEKLSDLKDRVVSGIINFVVETVAKKAVPKLVAMFVPGAGFISAAISIYDTIMVFVQKISKIVQVVTGFIDSIVTIAAGNIGAAASKVESILAGLLALAINFLAGFAGLSNVTEKITEVIQQVREMVDKALDWVINTIVGKAKAWFAKLFGKDKDKKPDEKGDFREKAKEDLASRFKGKLKHDEIQGIVNDVYDKYKGEGLKGVIAKPVEGKLDQYESILIASSIKVSTAEADFEINTSDLDLGWPRTVASAVLKAGSTTHVFGPQRNDGKNHAEENLIQEMNDGWEDIAKPKSTGITNNLTMSITRSPCGDAPKAHNCAQKIQQFVGRWQGKYILEMNVRAASIYGGKFRKSSREAIQKLAKSGITFTAWDLIAEMGDDTGDIPEDTLEKLQKRIDAAKENIPSIIQAGSGG